MLHHTQDAGAKKASKAKGGGKTIEQIYQKKTQLEHILLRPDTYGAWVWCIHARKTRARTHFHSAFSQQVTRSSLPRPTSTASRNHRAGDAADVDL